MKTALAMAAAALVIAPAIALAQSPPPGTPPAPVGHRQPRAADVPPDDSIVGGPMKTDSKGKAKAPRERRLDQGVPKVCIGCG